MPEHLFHITGFGYQHDIALASSGIQLLYADPEETLPRSDAGLLLITDDSSVPDD